VAGASERSLEVITASDLGRLSVIAAEDRAKLFETRPEYAGRLLCVALCQGAGLHFVDVARGKTPPNGVKDLDVWSFFLAIPGVTFPYRRSRHLDFGPSKFGRWSRELPKFRHFAGRRVDLFMRDLPVTADADPADALRSYLRARKTKTAKALVAKGLVLIDPPDRRGEIIWPE
jgi:hypothetical protein